MINDYNDIEILNIKSKLLQEIIALKNDNPDSLLLIQVGEFYETYFNDAKIFSEVTGLTLTSKFFSEVGNVAMSGVRKLALNSYLSILLKENFKTCVCEQLINENGEYYRKPTRIYTKGTIFEQEFLDSQENNFILAINQSDDLYKIAYADVSTGQFYKTITTKNLAILEIDKLCPNEILIPNPLKEKFENVLQKYNLTILDNTYNFLNPDEIIISYCKNMQKQFYSPLDEIVEYDVDTFMIMDDVTRKNLELTRTQRFLKKKGSLNWFLNNAKTPMGARLLKKYISEPLMDVDEIKTRQEAVCEIFSSLNSLELIENALENFNDLSRTCTRILNSTICPRDLFCLAFDILLLENIAKISSEFKSKLLKIDDYSMQKALKLANKILNAIDENAPAELKSGGIIKSGYNANLDYLRTQLENVYQELIDFEAKLKTKFGIKNLKVTHSSAIGYYIEIPKAKQTLIPDEYFKKQQLTNTIRYGNETLKNLESLIYEYKYRINELEYLLYCEIRSLSLEFLSLIKELAQNVAIIDVMASLARCAVDNNFVKPDFNNSSLQIKNGFHPSLLKLNNEIVKNDTKLNNHSMIILTGANMSGKSTYLKYNAIVCLLSQIGSFVPADSANVTILDKIFLRQGSSDDIINNNSSFMVEMLDLKYILDNATKNSLILLDEPAKSTNSNEGGAIARAYCEYLVEHTKAKTIIATHNLELTKLENYYEGKVENYVIGRADLSCKNILDRKIVRGIISSSSALNTAILAELPDIIIENAKKYTK